MEIENFGDEGGIETGVFAKMIGEIAIVQDAVEKIVAVGLRANTTVFAAQIADAHLRQGDGDAAMAALSVAENVMNEGGERFFESEVARLRGQVLLSQSNLDAAEEAQKSAIKIAASQGALSFELRSATDLAHLYRARGSESQARDLLAAVYDRFSEGFETTDLKNAQALLEELS